MVFAPTLPKHIAVLVPAGGNKLGAARKAKTHATPALYATTYIRIRAVGTY